MQQCVESVCARIPPWECVCSHIDIQLQALVDIGISLSIMESYLHTHTHTRKYLWNFFTLSMWALSDWQWRLCEVLQGKRACRTCNRKTHESHVLPLLQTISPLKGKNELRVYKWLEAQVCLCRQMLITWKLSRLKSRTVAPAYNHEPWKHSWYIIFAYQRWAGQRRSTLAERWVHF